MPKYSEWNHAIVDYFTRNIPRDNPLYLCVDDTNVAHIAMEYFANSLDVGEAKDDFLRAVREKVVSGNSVILDPISYRDSLGIPNSIAFLALMVYAAYQMADDSEITDANYFSRLREVLGLPTNVPGRPAGFKPAGVEVRLWKQWNAVLLENDWLLTAVEGNHQNSKFIHYPLSQSLLRAGDQEKLQKIFRESERAGALRKNYDADQLLSWLRNRSLPSAHLRELIGSTYLQQIEALKNAVYEVFEELDWTLDTTASTPSLAFQRRLTAGLYRSPDPISGIPKYKVYAPKPRRFSEQHLSALRNEETYRLEEDRDHPGWFAPLWTEPLGSASRYEIKGSNTIDELVMPERRFWVLVRDPINPDSQTFASWGAAEVSDAPFFLVCLAECEEQVNILKEEELLEWDRSRRFEDGGQEWIEYQNCEVIGFDWSGINPLDTDLCDALRPISSAFISLTGGLRVPGNIGWIAGHQPTVMIVSSSDDLLTILILDVGRESDVVRLEDVQTNAVIDAFPVLAAGNHLIQLIDPSSGKLLAQRQIRLSEWDVLEINLPDEMNVVSLGDSELVGGWLRPAQIDG